MDSGLIKIDKDNLDLLCSGSDGFSASDVFDIKLFIKNFKELLINYDIYKPTSRWSKFDLTLENKKTGKRQNVELKQRTFDINSYKNQYLEVSKVENNLKIDPKTVYICFWTDCIGVIRMEDIQNKCEKGKEIMNFRTASSRFNKVEKEIYYIPNNMFKIYKYI